VQRNDSRPVPYRALRCRRERRGRVQPEGWGGEDRHLDLVLDGKKHPTQRFARVVASLGSTYEYVVIDCPPSDRWPGVLNAHVPAAAEVERMGTLRAPLTVFAPRSRAAIAFQVLWNEVVVQMDDVKAAR
jgi:cellulose biosynthesis protein BcsQ